MKSEDIERTINSYLSIYSNGGGTLSPDGAQLAYVTDRDGVNQIYIRDMETNEESRLLETDDRCTNPRYLDDGSLIFSSDSGGDENFQLYVKNDDGIFQLTHGERVKYRFAFGTEKSVYLSANKENPKRFDIYQVQLPLSEKSEMEKVVEGVEFLPATPQLVNEDETKLLYSIVRSNLANDLFLWESGTTKSLTKDVFGDHNARFSPVEFLDDKTLLLTSDYQREFMSLAILDLEKREMVYLEEDNWDTTATHFHKETSTLYLAKNIEGNHKLFRFKVSDHKLGQAELLPMPQNSGVLASGDLRNWTKPYTLAKDGSVMVMTFSSPTTPTSLYKLNLTSLKITALVETESELNFVPASLAKFNSFDQLEVPYFYYNSTSVEKSPTIFLIHGGPEGQSTASFNKVIQLFANLGFSIVVPNIRGSNGYGRSYLALDDIEKRLDSIADIKVLADHIEATKAEADPSKFIVYGGSYGGFAVLSSITEYPERFNAAVDIVGISNFVTFLKNTADWRRRLREVEYGFLDKHREFLETVSPSNHIERVVTPTIIIQGDNDERVPLSESIQMYEKLREQNVPSELVRFADEGHGVVKRRNQIVMYTKILEFLDKRL